MLFTRKFSTHVKTKFAIRKKFKGITVGDYRKKFIDHTFSQFLHKMNQASFLNLQRVTVFVSEKVYLALLGLMHRGYVRTFRRVLQTYVVVLSTDDMGLVLYKRLEVVKRELNIKLNFVEKIDNEIFLREYVVLDPTYVKKDLFSLQKRLHLNFLNWILLIYF